MAVNPRKFYPEKRPGSFRGGHKKVVPAGNDPDPGSSAGGANDPAGICSGMPGVFPLCCKPIASPRLIEDIDRYMLNTTDAKSLEFHLF